MLLSALSVRPLSEANGGREKCKQFRNDISLSLTFRCFCSALEFFSTSLKEAIPDYHTLPLLFEIAWFIGELYHVTYMVLGGLSRSPII